MIDSRIENQLRRWAATYNTPDFIPDDPVQFPHRFTDKRDIEISAFLTAWISYGRRSHILAKAEALHQQMGNSPYAFIRNGDETFLPWQQEALREGRRNTFYRFYTYADLYALCVRLKEVYETFDSLEDALLAQTSSTPLGKLQQLFAGIRGIPAASGTSACKRLAMFLRWMVRTDGIVDFGIWRQAVRPDELLIPLDTHVHQISLALGLTRQKTASLRTAREITAALSDIFPGDPCLGDFALFGYDIYNTSLPPE